MFPAHPLLQFLLFCFGQSKLLHIYLFFIVLSMRDNNSYVNAQLIIMPSAQSFICVCVDIFDNKISHTATHQPICKIFNVCNNVNLFSDWLFTKTYPNCNLIITGHDTISECFFFLSCVANRTVGQPDRLTNEYAIR